MTDDEINRVARQVVARLSWAFFAIANAVGVLLMIDQHRWALMAFHAAVVVLMLMAFFRPSRP